MKNKISTIAYSNFIVVSLVSIFHERIEALSEYVLFFILIGYATFNAIYIQRELTKHKHLDTNLLKEKTFSSMILKTIPTGIVIISPTGVVEYVNGSVGKILGSIETVGLNILNFDTIINSGLNLHILDAINGNNSILNNINYVSFTSRKEKIINISISPFEYIESEARYRVILFIDDVTQSHLLKERIDAQYKGMFKSFVKLIDAKDIYTGKHSKNVSKYTEHLVMEMNLSNFEQEEIILAAMLHDIGKVGIRDSILNKAGALTVEEYEDIKKHPTIGYDLLSEIDDYQRIATIIRHHHEFWNGEGYPDGLKGDKIPIGSQVIAIADAYDAMTSDRVYRKRLSQEIAIQLLRNKAGTQFNSSLVYLFINIILDQEHHLTLIDPMNNIEIKE